MTPRSLTREFGLTAIKIALTAAVLLAIAWKFDFSAAIKLLATVALGTIFVGMILLLVQAWAASLRLRAVVLLFGGKINVAAALKLTLQGMFFNQAFVSVLGGDAFKIWRIHRLQMPLADATSAVALDRVAGFIGNHLTFVALLPWVMVQIDNVAVRWSLVVLAAVGLGGIALLLLLGLIGRRHVLIDLLPVRVRGCGAAHLLIELVTIGKHIIGNPRVALQIGALSAVLSLLNCSIFHAFLRGWNVDPILSLYCAMLVPVVMTISLLPLSVAGWGLREGATMLGFGSVGLDPEIGLAASVAFGLLNLAGGLIGGVLWLADRSLKEPATDRRSSAQQ